MLPSLLPVQGSLTSASAGPKALLTLNQAQRVKYYTEVSLQAVRDADPSPQCFDAAAPKGRRGSQWSRAPGASARSGLLTATCSTILAFLTGDGKLLSRGVLVGGGKRE